MNPNPQVQKPKVDNHGHFLQLLIDYPPQYKIGDYVKYYLKGGSITYRGYVTCRVFNEREKTWKYTIKDSHAYTIDDCVVLGYANE
jgi:hypothetical protein